MTKTILITGATDGIGLETAKMMAPMGHTLLLHGRNPEKLTASAKAVSTIEGAGEIKTYRADLSILSEVQAFADNLKSDFNSIDALINNAGVFKMSNPMTEGGYDARFIVNVIAPYMLTKALLPVLGSAGRVVNLSSAAQAPANVQGFINKQSFGDSEPMRKANSRSPCGLLRWLMSSARMAP